MLNNTSSSAVVGLEGSGSGSGFATDLTRAILHTTASTLAQFARSSTESELDSEEFLREGSGFGPTTTPTTAHAASVATTLGDVIATTAQAVTSTLSYATEIAQNFTHGLNHTTPAGPTENPCAQTDQGVANVFGTPITNGMLAIGGACLAAGALLSVCVGLLCRKFSAPSTRIKTEAEMRERESFLIPRSRY